MGVTPIVIILLIPCYTLSTLLVLTILNNVIFPIPVIFHLSTVRAVITAISECKNLYRMIL
jgi:hypothetical protein